MPSTVADVARRENGLITRSQALDSGVNTTQIDMQLRAHRWTRVLPEVYSTGGRATEPIPFIRAVWLSAGPGAVIEGEAALIWQGRLDRKLSQVSVSCGRNLRPPRGAGSIRVRRHVIDDYWVVQWNRVVTVRSEFAIAQLLESEGPEVLDEAVRRRWVTVDMVVDAHRRLSPGRGSVDRSKILSAAGGGAISEAERLLHHHLRAAGIRGWRANVSVRLGSISRTGDLVFEDIRLLVEVDGFAFHTDHRRFEDDRIRQNEFVVAGWTVLRFTWWALTQDAERVVQDIRAAIVRLGGR
jgi:very-short-patch-repair endonuclease